MRARVVALQLMLGAAVLGGGAAAVSTSPAAAPALSQPSFATVASVASTACGRRATATYRHVIWIWMENRNYSQVLGPSGSATRLKSYAAKCATATNYYAVRHPSLPNYLAATSGSTGGVATDCSPSSCPQKRASLFGQIGAKGLAWRSFAESMSKNCDLASYGRYAARHNPAVYYTPVRTACRSWDQPMGGSTGPFATELRNKTLRAFTFITPNLCHDGHDCSTSTADTWLGSWLDRIVSSPAYGAGNTAVFVVWDESLDTSNNHVASVVIAPSVHPGTRWSTYATHYSLLRTTERLLGLPLLGAAGSASSMRTLLP